MYGSVKRKTVIAIDFDRTISREPEFFKDMISRHGWGIDFYIVTYRSRNAYDDLLREFEELVGNKVRFTDAKAKHGFIDADIVIDDCHLSWSHDWKSYGFSPSEKLVSSGDLVVKKCKWQIANNFTGYNTKCGNSLKIESNERFIFCPYCGGEIVS